MLLIIISPTPSMLSDLHILKNNSINFSTLSNFLEIIKAIP